MANTFEVSATQVDGYRFAIDFHLPGVPELVADEPPPLGAAAGPNPARLLAGAIANCLAASLVFCLQKRHVAVEGVRARAEGALVRNERGRYRIEEIRVQLEPEVPEEDEGALDRCRELFQDFCIVTESVRHGIAVQVDVDPVRRSGDAVGGSPEPAGSPAEVTPGPASPSNEEPDDG